MFVDPATGVVTTKARLDRETKASYTLILVARDQGTPSQQATRRLNIIVKDIDDHPPQFIRTPVRYYYYYYYITPKTIQD